MTRLAGTFALVALTAVSSGCQEPLPPLGEALIVVDTDASVPRGVSRLRVDLYSHPDRTWIESRDIARPDARDWPVSFSVFSRDEANDSQVWVRLRAYADGRVRDVLEEPRLAEDEPTPATAIDKLLLVTLRPGDRGRVMTSLDTACAGRSSDVDAGQTCDGGLVEAVGEVTVEREVFDVPPSMLSDDTRTACAANEDPTRVCIPGGASILGSNELYLVPDYEAVPERLVAHAPFFMDRDEVTVARFRVALSQGFSPSIFPYQNDGPIAGDNSTASCSYSVNNLGREDYALTCMSWVSAQEMCQFYGGDLPTEAQYERAATLASDFGHSRFAWGDQDPSCERAIYGRLRLAGLPGACETHGTGPVSTTANQFDVTREGVFGLAGGVAEWMRDDYRRYDDPCWQEASATEPVCITGEGGQKSLRGATWGAPPTFLPAAVRVGSHASARTSLYGFRCVYP